MLHFFPYKFYFVIFHGEGNATRIIYGFGIAIKWIYFNTFCFILLVIKTFIPLQEVKLEEIVLFFFGSLPSS